MSYCIFQVLYPIWIGIAFNILIILFNMIAMVVMLHSAFVDWYLEEYGVFKIMGCVWGLLILWSIANAATC